MTEMLFRDNAYLKVATGCVVGHSDQGGVILDRTIFYPTGGGQPGDGGALHWETGSCGVAICVKGDGDDLICVPEASQNLPPIGTEVRMELDWERRFSHMRVHTALHLLSVAVPFGVTGGSISVGKGRLDFDMAHPPEDKDAIAAQINKMIAGDAVVSEEWITEAELDAQPDLVKTLAVKPPRGSGHIRLIRIGEGEASIDLQPCGGTHVSTLSEIGYVRLGKTEKKGRMNRRVYLHLID